MIMSKKNNSRNVVICHCVDPLSILALVGAGLVRGAGGLSIRYAPEIQIKLARCLIYRKRRGAEKENTYKDDIDPQKYMENIQQLIASDPNCTPDPNFPRVVNEDISARYLPLVDVI